MGILGQEFQFRYWIIMACLLVVLGSIAACLLVVLGVVRSLCECVIESSNYSLLVLGVYHLLKFMSLRISWTS